MARRRSVLREEEIDIDEQLDELEHQIKRLRVEYEQYFAGVMKRPPQVLQGRIQKTIARFSSELPQNTRLKFRFNQLNARYQVFRQQWGRIMRQIEEGTYAPHRFRAGMRVPEAPSTSLSAALRRQRRATGSDIPVRKLHEALVQARRQTGDHGPPPDPARLAVLLRKQTEAIRAKQPDARIAFRVVVEGGKAKLRASVNKR